MTRYHFKHQIPTFRHGDGTIIVCGCFSQSKVTHLLQVKGKIDRFRVYISIINKYYIQKDK